MGLPDSPSVVEVEESVDSDIPAALPHRLNAERLRLRHEEANTAISNAWGALSPLLNWDVDPPSSRAAQAEAAAAACV